MRVISQDGLITVPYESVIIRADENGQITARSIYDMSEQIILAEYCGKCEAENKLKRLNRIYSADSVVETWGSEECGHKTTCIKANSNTTYQFPYM